MGRAILAYIMTLLMATGAAVAGASAVDAAKAALAAKDDASAIKLTTNALGEAGTSKADATALHVIRGQAYLAEEQFDDAVADFNAVIDPSAAPTDVCAASGDVFVFRGDAYVGLRRFRDGSEDFKRALLCEPENAIVRLKLGGAYFYFDKTSAVGAFNEAIRLKPDYKEAFVSRGQNFENMQEFDKALADYGEVLRLDPDDARTYNNRATIYSALGRLDEALADYNKSIKLKPTDFMSFLNRAYLYYWKKDYKAARADVEKAKQLRADPKAKPDLIKLSNSPFLKRVDADMAQLDEDLANAPP